MIWDIRKTLYMLRKYQKYEVQNENHLKFKSHFHGLLLSRRLDTV